jgi:outer membrane protein assembly factor BamC
MNSLNKRCKTPVLAKNAVISSVTLACLIALAGCELLPDKRAEYKKTTTLPSLEVPPNLTASRDDELVVPDINPSNTATYSDYSKERQKQGDSVQVKQDKTNILSTAANIQLKREGATRWLEIQDSPEKIWHKTREFWGNEGFKLKREDKRLGVIETDWNENRGDIPDDMIRKTLGKLLDSVYSASTRDKFLVRIEPSAQAGGTDVYLSHRGLKEVSQGSDFIWESRQSDPDLEAEMLSRLMVFLGLEKNQAQRIVEEKQTVEVEPNAKQQQNAQGHITALQLPSDFARSWRRTGLALDRTGFTVEDRDRSQGLFFVRYVPDEIQAGKKEKTVVDKLAFWRSDDPIKSQDLQIKVSEIDGQNCQITVLNQQSQAADALVADSLLKLLYSQLK